MGLKGKYVGAEDMHHSIDSCLPRYSEFLSKLDEYGILDKGISVWCNDLGNGYPIPTTMFHSFL